MHRSRLLLLAALLLSGCFRPAGDSIEPTTDFTAEVGGSSGATATMVTPAITLLSPDTDTTSEPTSESAGASDGGIALTAVTLAPETATPTVSQSTSGDATATLQLITPGMSLGLVTPDTPTPLPTRSATPIGGAAMSSDETEEASFAAFDSAGDCTYTVQPGDSLYQIAIINDTTVTDLQDANPDLEGDPPILQIGDVLNLPDCLPGTPRATQAQVVSGTEEATTDLPAGSQIYVVQPGDVLGAIASRFGVTVNAIVRANDMSNPDSLSIGQELIIPVAADN